MSIPDNYSQWQHHEAERERRAKRFPICCKCEERIFDGVIISLKGDDICQSCLSEIYDIDVRFTY